MNHINPTQKGVSLGSGTSSVQSAKASFDQFRASFNPQVRSVQAQSSLAQSLMWVHQDTRAV